MILKKPWQATVLTALVLSLMLMAAPRVWAEAKADGAEIKADMIRFKAMGGLYRVNGFAEFPNKNTPFPRYDRIATQRLRGKLIYVTLDGVVIRKTYYCGPMGTVYAELWVPDGKGGIIPFAWQDCMFFCSGGGSPSGSNPLYLDLTGNGNPEVRFDWLSDISSEKSKASALVRTFNGDPLPAWVRRLAGKSLKKLSSERMPAGMRFWRDDAAWVSDVMEDAP